MRKTGEQPVVTALGAGGEFGIGANLGILEVLKTAGVDLRDVPHLGTSAGAWAAGMVALGLTIEHTQELRPVDITDPMVKKPGFLTAVATELFGSDARVDNVRATTVRIPSPRRPFSDRRILSSQEHGLPEIVAASGTVPTLFHSTEVEGEDYVDGGMPSLTNWFGSMTHADQAPAADWLLVTAPLAFPLERSLSPASFLRSVGGAAVRSGVSLERARWERSHGGRSVLVTPDAKTAHLVESPVDLFNRKIALEACKRTVDAVGERLGDPDDALAEMVRDLTSRASGLAA